ncbi:MAG: right-handed parallel beta-helix repeat-containing protein [Thiothrix sp.]|nr:MAG: right-handed parallel beta-helix repeat-containing protein [Thiothrix sp.]
MMVFFTNALASYLQLSLHQNSAFRVTDWLKLRIITVLVSIFLLSSNSYAAQVNLLNSTSTSSTGAGAAGTPSLSNFNIPAGKNRMLFIFAAFERDHCDQITDTCYLSSSASSVVGLSDNYSRISATNQQITAQVVGTGGTINRQNALVIGGTPSGDTRFSWIETTLKDSVGVAIPNSTLFSGDSFHIALLESDINTLLSGASTGNVSISLPDMPNPKNAGDDALLMAFVFDNVEQTASGLVRSAVPQFNTPGTGTAGNYTLSATSFDAGQAPNDANDGLLVVGVSTLGQPTSTGGFLTMSGYTQVQSLTTNNPNGRYDNSEPTWVTSEPDGFSASAQFRNGIIAGYALQSAGASSLVSYGGWAPGFTISSDNADISDAPSTYGNPTHTISGIRLGASVDADAAVLANATASGDDTNGTDDENGVTIPVTLTASIASVVPVSIQNASGYLNAWFDWNLDGDFLDSGEQVATDQAVVTGTTNLSVTPPATAVTGTTFARFRVCTTTSSCNTPTSTAASGEIEDYQASMIGVSLKDYSDAPSAYGTPYHTIVAGVRLGTTAPDAETAQPTPLDGTGDDTTTTDDEDGITLPTLTQGQTATITATTTGAGGYLQGWIDFNGDGDFADAGEQVASNIQDNLVGDTNASAGIIAFSVNVPATATASQTYARFRWSTTSGLNSTTAASNGEVEDYAVIVGTAPLSCGKFVKKIAAGSGDGSTWDNAIGEANLRAALQAGGTICIAEGTYIVNTGGVFNAALIGDGTTVIGSFPNSATGTDLSGYDFELHPTIIDGNQKRVLDLGKGTISLKGLEINNSNGGGTGGSAIRASAGGQPYDWTIEDCAFRDTTGVGASNAVWILPGGFQASSGLKISNCTFENNVITGGAHGAALRLEGVSNNLYTNDGQQFVIENVNFTNNSSTGGSPGGAVEILTSRGLNFYNVNFCGNHTDNYGGALHASDGDNMVFDKCNVTGNSNGAEYGGAFRFTGSDNIRINQCDFVNNDSTASSVGAGGAIAIESGSPYTITNSNFYNNRATQRGGAITFQGGGDITIGNSTFKANEVKAAIAVTGGGAVYVMSGAGRTIQLNNSVFDSNSAKDNPATTPESSGGGAITVGGGASPVTDSNKYYSNSYNGHTTNLEDDIFVYGGGVFTARNSTLQPSQASFNASYNVSTGNTFNNMTDPGVASIPIGFCPVSLPPSTSNKDFGDAPVNGSTAPNGTTGATSYGEASHIIVSGIHLGTSDPDADSANQPSANADGDDSTGSDDENGITLSTLAQGQTATINATVAGAGGYLQGWIDWNGNGSFEANEKIAPNLQDNATGDLNSTAGVISFAVSVPSFAITTTTYARFRWSTTTDLNATTAASDGEVEDYAVTVNAASALNASACTVTTQGAANGSSFPWPGSSSTVTVTTTNNWSATATNTLFRDLQNYSRPLKGTHRWDKSGEMTLTLNFSPAVPAKEINLYINDIGYAASEANDPRVSFAVSGSAKPSDFVMQPLTTGSTTLAYIAASGTILKQTSISTSREHGILVGQGTNLVSQLSLSTAGISGSDFVAYVLGANLDCDFGDAPDTAGSGPAAGDYETLGASNGPQHQFPAIPTLYLGAGITSEPDALQNATATGDSDNGVTLPTLTQTQTASITATVVGTGGYLQGWIDWNGDGDFLDAGEQVATNLQDNGTGDTNATAGTITFNVTTPAATVTTQTFARFRWSNISGLTVNALATNGEVEDYALMITPSNTLSGVVFEDINYGGGNGRSQSIATGIGINGVRVELYNNTGSLISTTTTANNGTTDGAYSFTVVNGQYYVRVVSDSVNSTRTGSNGSELAVQTYRTDGTTAVVNEVGGLNPSLADSAMNSGTDTLNTSTLKLASGAHVQSLQAVTLSGSSISGIDFGFNFDTIVNTNDAGQGSLRQFILNSNLLGGETSLAQAGSRKRLDNINEPLPSAYETSIFMIPSSALTAGVAKIQITSGANLLPSVTGSKTILDATTQTTNQGDTNNDLLGTGGTVGVDALTLPKIPAPEVELFPANAGYSYGLHLNNSGIIMRGFAAYGFGSDVNSNGIVVVGSSGTGVIIEQNVLGTTATSFTSPALRGQGSNIQTGATGGFVRNNLIGFSGANGLRMNGSTWTVKANEIRSNGTGSADGLWGYFGSSMTIEGNLITDSASGGYDGLYRSSFTNNTVTNNGRDISSTEDYGVSVVGG